MRSQKYKNTDHASRGAEDSTRGPKYRRLTQTELASLRPEFVQFLASRGIPAADWVQLKEAAPDKVEALIILFSDIVLEKILTEVNLVESRNDHEIMLYQFEEQKIKLRGIRWQGDGTITGESLKDTSDLTRLLHEGNAKVQLISAEKSIQDAKPSEVFTLLTKGCLMSKNQDLFLLLDKLSRDKS